MQNRGILHRHYLLEDKPIRLAVEDSLTVWIELHVVQLARPFLRWENTASIDPDDVDIAIFIDIDFWIHGPAMTLRNLRIIHQNKMAEGIPSTTVFSPIPIGVRADIFLILARNLIDCVSGVSH